MARRSRTELGQSTSPRIRKRIKPRAKPTSSGSVDAVYSVAQAISKGAKKTPTPSKKSQATLATGQALSKKERRQLQTAVYGDKDAKFKSKRDRRIQARAEKLRNVLAPPGERDEISSFEVGKLAKKKVKPAGLERGLFASLAIQQDKLKKQLNVLPDVEKRENTEVTKARQIRAAISENESEMQRLKSRQFERAARQTDDLLQKTKKRVKRGELPEAVLKDVRKFREKMEDKQILALQRHRYHSKVADRRLSKFEIDYRALMEKRQKIKQATSVQELVYNAGANVISVATGKPGRHELYNTPAVRASGKTVPKIYNDPDSPTGTITIRNDAGKVRKFQLKEDEKLSALDIALFLTPIPVVKAAQGFRAIKAAVGASKAGQVAIQGGRAIKGVPGIAATDKGIRAVKTGVKTDAITLGKIVRDSRGGVYLGKVGKGAASIPTRQKSIAAIREGVRKGDISPTVGKAAEKAFNRPFIGAVARQRIKNSAAINTKLGMKQFDEYATHLSNLSRKYTVPQKTLLGTQRVARIALTAAKHPIGSYVVGAVGVGAIKNPKEQIDALGELGGGIASIAGDVLTGNVNVDWGDLPDDAVNLLEAAARLGERVATDSDFRDETFGALFEAGAGLVILPFYLTHETIVKGPEQVIKDMAKMTAEDLEYRWGPAFDDDWETFMDRAEDSGGAAWYFLDLWPAAAAASWGLKGGAVAGARIGEKLSVPGAARSVEALTGERPGLAITSGGLSGVREQRLSNRLFKTGKQRALDSMRGRKRSRRERQFREGKLAKTGKEYIIPSIEAAREFEKIVQPLWDGKLLGTEIPIVGSYRRERVRLSKRLMGGSEMRHQEYVNTIVKPMLRVLAGRRFRGVDGKIYKGLSKDQQKLMPYTAWILGDVLGEADISSITNERLNASRVADWSNPTQARANGQVWASHLESHRDHILAQRRQVGWEDTSVPLKTFEVEVLDELINGLKTNPQKYLNKHFRGTIEKYQELMRSAEALDPALGLKVLESSVYKTQLEFMRKNMRNTLKKIDQRTTTLMNVIYDVFAEENPNYPSTGPGRITAEFPNVLDIDTYAPGGPVVRDVNTGNLADEVIDRYADIFKIDDLELAKRDIVANTNASIKRTHHFEMLAYKELSEFSTFLMGSRSEHLKRLDTESINGIGPDQTRVLATFDGTEESLRWALERHNAGYIHSFLDDLKTNYPDTWLNIVKEMKDEVHRLTQEFLKGRGFPERVLVYRSSAQSNFFDASRPMAFSLSPINWTQKYMPTEVWMVDRNDILSFANTLNKAPQYADEVELSIIPNKAVRLGESGYARSPIGNPRVDYQRNQALSIATRLEEELGALREVEDYKLELHTEYTPGDPDSNVLFSEAQPAIDGQFLKQEIYRFPSNMQQFANNLRLTVVKYNGKDYLTSGNKSFLFNALSDLYDYSKTRFNHEPLLTAIGRFKENTPISFLRVEKKETGWDNLITGNTRLVEFDKNELEQVFKIAEYLFQREKVSIVGTKFKDLADNFGDAYPIGSNQWIDHLVNVDISRINEAAFNNGLGIPFYYKSAPIEDLPFDIDLILRTKNIEKLIPDDIKDLPPSKLAAKDNLLFRLGIQDLNPEVQLAGLLQKGRRYRDLDRIQSMVKEAGLRGNDALDFYNSNKIALPPSVGTKVNRRQPLEDLVVKSGAKREDYIYINMDKLNELMDQVDQGATLTDSRKGMLGYQRQRHAELARVLKEGMETDDTGRWVAVHKTLMEPILQEFNKFDNKVITAIWDMPKALASRLLLAPNLSWLQFQVYANALLGGIAGVGPKSWIEAQERYRKLTPEAKRAVDQAMGVQTLAPDVSKMNQNLFNFWHHWLTKSYGYRRHLEGRNILDAFFFVDRKNNQFFRKAVLHNRMKKEAYRRLNGRASSLLNTMNMIMKKHNKSDVDDMFESIARDRKAMDRLAKDMESFMGDYLNFSVTERALMQRTVMFYGFLRHSLQFTLRTLPIEHPVRMGLLAQLSYQATQDVKGMLGVEDLDYRLLGKFYLKGPIDVPFLGRVEPAKNGLLEVDLARASVVGNFFMEALSAPSTAYRIASSTNPVIVPILEAMAGVNFYTGTPLRTSTNPQISYNLGQWSTWFSAEGLGGKARYVINRELTTFLRPLNILGQATSDYPFWRKGADSMVFDERPYRYSTEGDAFKEAARDIKRFRREQEGGFLPRPVQRELFPFLPAPTGDPELIKFLEKQKAEDKAKTEEKVDPYRGVNPYLTDPKAEPDPKKLIPDPETIKRLRDRKKKATSNPYL